MILQISSKLINNNFGSILANISKKNQNILSNINGKNIDKDIENLLFIIKLAKFKKLKLIKSNSFKTNFLTLGAKETFIYL